ncbi:hypothetical protein ACNF36_02555 [Mycoplasma sp. 4463]|uniref:hypothetical protein n=1 Tax=Mycoplasma sp. 4463 TaxID=3400998 RepID=UPI003AAAFB9F
MEFEINDDGTINSKQLIFEYNRLKKKVEVINEIMIPELNFIRDLEAVKVFVISLAVIASASALVSHIVNLFTWGSMTLVALVSTGIAAALSTIAALIDGYVQHRKSIYDEMAGIKEKLFSEDMFFGLWTAATLWLSFVMSVAGLKDKITSEALALNLFRSGISDAQSTLSTGANVAGLIGSAVSLGTEINDIVQTAKSLSANKTQKLEYLDEVARYAVGMQKIEKVEWVVIDETKLDKPYNEGGRGGQNRYFFNLKTKQTRHISHFLNMSKQELAMNGFIKVKSKTRGQYIKRIPNKTKEDNLG